MYNVEVFNRFDVLAMDDTCFSMDDSTVDEVYVAQDNVAKVMRKKRKVMKSKFHKGTVASQQKNNDQVKGRCVDKGIKQFDCSQEDVILFASSSHQDDRNKTIIQVKFGSKVVSIQLRDSENLAVENLLDIFSSNFSVDKKLIYVSVNGKRSSNEVVISSSDLVEIVFAGIGGGRSKKSRPHEGECICCVCHKGKDQSHFYHLKDMTDCGDQESARVSHHLLQQNYSPESCLCYNCRRRVSRNLGIESSPGFQSVSKKLRICERPKCMLSEYDLCHDLGIPCSFDLTIISECFSVNFPAGTEVVLCSRHGEEVKATSHIRFPVCIICTKNVEMTNQNMQNF